MERQSGVKVRLTEDFINDLSLIYSEKLFEQIVDILHGLQHFPDMGSADVRSSLIKRFGSGIRKIGVSTFVIIYRHTGNSIEVLALVYGPRIK
jgi:plasmid stabilization system protein ParE